VRGIIGGAGTYSALGARLLSPGALSLRVGWIVDAGRDFPKDVQAQIESWKTAAIMRYSLDRLTTRGLNEYGSVEHRAFCYITPKRRITAGDLELSSMLWARSFHLICSPQRCQEQVAEIERRRMAQATPQCPYTRPIYIWEPVPDLCTPEELKNCADTVKMVDVCSPNHSELAAFLGSDGLDPGTGEISLDAIETGCRTILSLAPDASCTFVIRAGSRGCYVARNGHPKTQTDAKQHDRTAPVGMESSQNTMIHGEGARVGVHGALSVWLPAYHRDGAKVVDPTGGGNTFLGGMAVALARGKGVVESAIWGSVAASFAIEQYGVPELSTDESGWEIWNGTSVHSRLEEFSMRVGI
jgi:sugar/nucleoside kinase (ribokinase family)